jgi:enterochelin esterase-like enzyme
MMANWTLGTDAWRLSRRLVTRVVTASVAVALVAAGVAGAAQYGVTFWLYRGFAPPSAPKTIIGKGHHKVAVKDATVVRLVIKAPSLGGWDDVVYVVLPPGYSAASSRRYPVLYLLHGTPGVPTDFLQAGDLVPTYEVLLAEGLIKPMIMVLPTGGKSFFADTEWANGVQADSGWETFISHTLVQSIDQRYHTIESAAGRGIAGLSEGGYGALNIGFHHLNEFSLFESWSGYEYADKIPAIFGRTDAVMRANSPFEELPTLAPVLKADHDYVWMYIGASDPLLHQNQDFAAALRDYGVPSAFRSLPGHHSWALWRQMMSASLITASEHLSHV